MKIHIAEQDPRIYGRLPGGHRAIELPFVVWVEGGETLLLVHEGGDEFDWHAIDELGAGPGGADVTFSLNNGEVVTIDAGTPVVSSGDGFAVRANASSLSLSSVIGIVKVGADPTLPMEIQGVGALDLMAAEWDAITGQSGGLTPAALYYLSPTAGMLSTSAPTTPGKSVTVVGRALTTTTLLLEIAQPVYL